MQPSRVGLLGSRSGQSSRPCGDLFEAIAKNLLLVFRGGQALPDAVLKCAEAAIPAYYAADRGQVCCPDRPAGHGDLRLRYTVAACPSSPFFRSLSSAGPDDAAAGNAALPSRLATR